MHQNSNNVLRSNLRQHEKRSRKLSRSLEVIIALTKNSGLGVAISGNSVQKTPFAPRIPHRFHPGVTKWDGL